MICMQMTRICMNESYRYHVHAVDQDMESVYKSHGCDKFMNLI